MHPSFIFYWNEISVEQFKGLLEWLKVSKVDSKLILPYGKTEQEKFEVGSMEMTSYEVVDYLDELGLGKAEVARVAPPDRQGRHGVSFRKTCTVSPELASCACVAHSIRPP